MNNYFTAVKFGPNKNPYVSVRNVLRVFHSFGGPVVPLSSLPPDCPQLVADVVEACMLTWQDEHLLGRYRRDGGRRGLCEGGLVDGNLLHSG